MTLEKAESLTKHYLNIYLSYEWTVSFLHLPDGIHRFGHCDTKNKIIYLSAIYVENADYDDVRDTILHEIAHGMTPGNGHGFLWEIACKQIGARPERYFRDLKSKPKLNSALVSAAITVLTTHFGIPVALQEPERKPMETTAPAPVKKAEPMHDAQWMREKRESEERLRKLMDDIDRA